MAERVELTGRPGTFFVVCRSLGNIRLLDEQDREFVVTADQVRPPRGKIKAKPADGSGGNSTSQDFSQYTEFVNFLLAHREHVHLYFRGRRSVKPQICDRYLELTGEELPEDFIFTMRDDNHTWNVAAANVVFPSAHSKFLVPSKIHLCSEAGWEFICNIKFTWYLIEQHGFRCSRKFLRGEKGFKKDAR